MDADESGAALEAAADESSADAGGGSASQAAPETPAAVSAACAEFDLPFSQDKDAEMRAPIASRGLPSAAVSLDSSAAGSGAHALFSLSGSGGTTVDAS